MSPLLGEVSTALLFYHVARGVLARYFEQDRYPAQTIVSIFVRYCKHVLEMILYKFGKVRAN